MTTVSRPALDVIQVGGSTTLYDGDGNIRQIIGTQPDGSFGVTQQNGTPPDASSTPVVIDATLGLTVTWDGLMADQAAGAMLNANSDFEAGLAPWNTLGAGAAVAQSSTRHHGGGFAAQFTPNGINDTIGFSSEQLSVTAGQDYQVDGWAWITAAVTGAFSLSIDWYDSDGQFLSTSSTLDDLPAATWSEVLNSYTAPTGAVSATITATLTTPGTPIAATQVWYLDDVTLKPVTFDTPADFDHVAVHVSETTGFTPDGSTLQGTLRHAGNFPVTPLDGGTEYFVKLVGVNTSGIAGTASAQASGTPSEVVATDIADGIVTTLKLADDAVTAAKIAAAAVGTTEIADDAITTPKIVAGAIETDLIAAGAVDTDQLAAEAVTTAKLDALAVTADQLAANAVTAGKIDAGAVTADALEGTLVLGSEIVAGDEAGARVQLDSSGIAAYDQDGNQTVVVGSDGNAVFNGSSVSASEMDADRFIVNSPTDGGFFAYGTSNTPLNSNPDFATGTTHWSATATTISYSSTFTINGHNTMKLVRSGGPATVLSDAITVTAGVSYQLGVQAFGSQPTPPAYAQIQWFNSGGTMISRSTSPSAVPGTLWTNFVVSAVAPTGAVTAKIQIGFTVTPTGSQGNSLWVAYAALTATNVLTSLTNDAGTDAFGNSYPAGLSTSALNIGGFKWGRTPATQQTDASGSTAGTTTITHGLNGPPTSVVITPTGSAATNFRPFIKSLTSTTFVVGWVDTATYVVVTGAHQLPFCWFAAV